ncbi:MAG: DUF427 domain-containing protein [Candidatus Dormibacteraeota bacterium]|nr:DUF427 domain-containing protein [Candidatus Dormibacteraeota bacterium]
MSLTLGPGPLGTQPDGDANYGISGPKHRIWFQEHPHRIRAEIAGQVVLDTVRGHLLHESNIPPRLYVPLEDFNGALLEPTEFTTHCPFKGDAAYYSVRVGSDLRENAVWAYPKPNPDATWLAPFASLYWERADAWYEEDERLLGLRDPYHRVDTRRTSRPVRVVADDGSEIARSERAVLVFETGLPARAYLPREDVAAELVPSAKRSICPYKGEASYFSVRLGDRLIEDAAWTYEQPLGEALGAGGLVSFLHEQIEVDIAQPGSRPVGAPGA